MTQRVASFIRSLSPMCFISPIYTLDATLQALHLFRRRAVLGTMARILDWLGRFCARNRRWVLAVWGLVEEGGGGGRATKQVGQLPRVATVENPYGGTGGIKGKNAVVAVAHLKGTARDLGPGDMRALEEATAPARLAGVDVDYGGIVSLFLFLLLAGFVVGV